MNAKKTRWPVGQSQDVSLARKIRINCGCWLLAFLLSICAFSARAADCSTAILATAAGSSDGAQQYQGFYLVRNAAHERPTRNWFEFNIPSLAGQKLVGAELRLYAQTIVGSTDIQFDLRAAPRRYAYNELLNGPLFGQAVLRAAESSSRTLYEGPKGRLLAIPLTPEAVAAITGAAGGVFRLGGLIGNTA